MSGKSLSSSIGTGRPGLNTSKNNVGRSMHPNENKLASIASGCQSCCLKHRIA